MTIFTTTSCPHCKVLKKYCVDHDISYIEKNTDVDNEAMAELVAQDIWSVPTVKYQGKYKLIHDVEEFKEFIQ